VRTGFNGGRGAAGARRVRDPAWTEAAEARPLLVFDGDCAFCRQWVRRAGGGVTGKPRVSTGPSQEVAGQLPEIGEGRFPRAKGSGLIEPDGRGGRAGRGAVFPASTPRARPKTRLAGLGRTRNLPAFAALAEAAYGPHGAAPHGRRPPRRRVLWGTTMERPAVSP